MAMAETLLLKRKPGKSAEAMEPQRLKVIDNAHQLCKEYLQGPWAKIPLNEFEIMPLGGGLTNKLYICNLPEKYKTNDNDGTCPNSVLLRVYGLILQDFKAQIQESIVFSILAERGVGPRLYAVFPGGRLEEYLSSRTLITSDLRDESMSRHIAENMAEYHQLKMPVNKEPTYITGKLFKYLEKSKSMLFDEPHSQKLYNEFLNNYDIDSLVEFVILLIGRQEPVVVFCHNDVQEGNLLYAEREDRGNPVQMIDFEYSSYNYRGFDIANHFCEWMYDYSHPTWPFYHYEHDNYPTHQQQVNFIDAYLEAAYRLDPKRRSDSKWQRDYLIEEARRFAMLSHVFWSLWSVVQSQMSDIGFGYLEYALVRLKSLTKQRDEWKL